MQWYTSCTTPTVDTPPHQLGTSAVPIFSVYLLPILTLYKMWMHCSLRIPSRIIDWTQFRTIWSNQKFKSFEFLLIGGSLWWLIWIIFPYVQINNFVTSYFSKHKIYSSLFHSESRKTKNWQALICYWILSNFDGIYCF